MDNHLTQLRRLITKHCNLDELRTLCFDLGVNWDELPGDDTLSAKTRELLLHLGRQRKLDKLLTALQDNRPDLAAEPALNIDVDALYAALPDFEADVLKRPIRFQVRNVKFLGIAVIVIAVILIAVIFIITSQSQPSKPIAATTTGTPTVTHQPTKTATPAPTITATATGTLTVTHQPTQTAPPTPTDSCPTGEPVDEAKFGIAVAEFTVGSEHRQAPVGCELSQQIYQQLDNELARAGLKDKIALTRVGPVRDADEAQRVGEQVNADMVLWGWVTEYAPAPNTLSPNLTLIGDQPIKGDGTLVGALNVMISTPGTVQLNQLSGGAMALTRFVLGIVYLRSANEDGACQRAITMFDKGIKELKASTQVTSSLSFKETLAKFYTFKGMSHAACRL